MVGTCVHGHTEGPVHPQLSLVQPLEVLGAMANILSVHDNVKPLVEHI